MHQEHGAWLPTLLIVEILHITRTWPCVSSYSQTQPARIWKYRKHLQLKNILIEVDPCSSDLHCLRVDCI